MSQYFSSQESIQKKARALRVRVMTDKDGDGISDSETLEQAFQVARNEICDSLAQRYGSQVYDWTLATVPNPLKGISDDISLMELSSGTMNMQPVISENYERARERLSEYADCQADGCYKRDLPNVSDYDNYQIVTETYTSRMYPDNDTTCSV